MIAVIGAANIDITASPIGRYVPCDSNPSRVEISFGGVGRNIAHNLCLMGDEVRLFTVFGDDSIALSLRDDCRRVGMTVDPILEVAGARSNYFICVNDHNGEFAWTPFDCKETISCVLCTHASDKRELVSDFIRILRNCYKKRPDFPV